MGTQLDLDDVAADHPLALQELAALRKDAERYRWLRDEEGALNIFTAYYWNTNTADELDAAVDAAMAVRAA